MKISGVLPICCAGVLLLLVGTPSFAAGMPSDIITITVAADPPLAANQFPPPGFTPPALGAQSSSSFEQGNWHYTIHYRYGNQGWEVTKYEARRIHPSGQAPIVKQVLRPMAGCGGGSVNATRGLSSGMQPSDCGPIGDGGPPPDSDLTPPPVPINHTPNAGDTVTQNHTNFEDSGWDVVAKWTWVIGPGGTGHWELTYVLKTKVN